MDIDFVVQDIFALTRPQWSFAPNLEEATKALQQAVAQDQKSAGADKIIEADEASSGESSDDDNADLDEMDGEDGDGDDESLSEEDEEVDVSIAVNEAMAIEIC